MLKRVKTEGALRAAVNVQMSLPVANQTHRRQLSFRNGMLRNSTVRAIELENVAFHQALLIVGLRIPKQELATEARRHRVNKEVVVNILFHSALRLHTSMANSCFGVLSFACLPALHLRTNN